VDKAPHSPQREGPRRTGGTRRTQYRICVSSYEMKYIHVAEGSILRDMQVTSLIIIGDQLSNSGRPPTGHLPHWFEGFKRVA